MSDCYNPPGDNTSVDRVAGYMYRIASNFHSLKPCHFALKVNFSELLVSSTLISLSTSHACCEEIFVNKIFMIQEY